MKHAMKITLTALVALGLTACGAETSGEMDHKIRATQRASSSPLAPTAKKPQLIIRKLRVWAWAR